MLNLSANLPRRELSFWDSPLKWVSPASSIVLLMCLGAFGGAVYAQDDGRSIKVGEGDLFPSLRIDYLTNDNAFLTPDDETDANGVRISPTLSFVAERRLLQLRLQYAGEYENYNESALNFDDHVFSLDADAELSSRKRVRGRIRIAKEHEEFGRGITRGIASPDIDLIDFVTVDVGGAYTFGAKNATGNLEFGLDIRDRSYQSEPELTEGLDYTQITPRGQFTYRLSDRSRALLELGVSNWSFSDSTDDRNDIFFNTGLLLSQGGKSGGSVRVGATRQVFDDSDRDDTTEITADIAVFYRPVTFSRFDLRVERSFDDIDDTQVTSADSQEISDLVRLGWVHSWSSRVRSRSFVSHNSTSRSCPEQGTDLVSAGLEFGLDVRSWVELGAGIVGQRRKEDSCPNVDVSDGLDFDRQIANIFVRVAL